MAKIGIALLALWAVLATAGVAWLLASRTEAPAPPRSGLPSREEEGLRERVRELEEEVRRRDAIRGTPSDVSPAPSDDTPGIMPGEAGIRALIEAYRKRVANGVALDEDLRRALELTFDEPRHPDVTPMVLEVASRLFRSDPDPRRGQIGARIFVGYGSPSSERFRVWLDDALAETDAAMRSYLLGEMSSHGWGLDLPPDDVRAFVEMLRGQVRAGNTDHVSGLAHWSDRREDFDFALSLLGSVREPEPRRSVLTAFRKGVRMTRGREEEARGELLRVLADPTEDRAVRDYAVDILNSHRPWDEATAGAVRLYFEQTKGD